jgi:eukaryotic-like serine/threonine-protein kinase
MPSVTSQHSLSNSTSAGPLPRRAQTCSLDRWPVRWRIVEYRAADRLSGETVVLKIPHPGVVGDLAAYSRYQREITIGARLNHQGIQRTLTDRGNGHGRRLYMVLEYVDGQSLRSYLRSHPRLAVEEILRIGCQLGDVLDYVHEQGIVHRDLKPENILIAPGGVVKLSDFGIALSTTSRRLTFSHLSNAVGTPDYMAPEQVRGERGDACTDVYALGVLLYELLAGKVPYPADDALEAMRRKVETDPPLVRKVRADAPPALEAVIYRALRRNPQERYQSVAGLREDLEHLDLVVIPVYRQDGPPPEPPGELPPWRTTAAVLVIILAILAGLAVLAELAHRTLSAH